MDQRVRLPGRNQRTARAGECYVAAELNRRGGYAVTLAGNMPGIDVMATDADRERTVYIQVETKRRGTWHASKKLAGRSPRKDHFWVFVDLGLTNTAKPKYWVVPEAWILSDIKDKDSEWRERHKEDYTVESEPPHQAIGRDRLPGWSSGNWEIVDLRSCQGE